MAYQPSLSDLSSLDNSQGYSPSLEDLSGLPAPQINQPPKMVETFMSSIPFVGKLPAITDTKNIIPTLTEEDIRKGSGAALAALPSPIKALPLVSNLLSKIPMGKSIGNVLGRIGYGTAATTAPELFTEEGREKLPETAERNLKLNALLEGASYPLGRAYHGIAELFNPIQHSRNLARQIKAEHDVAENTMKANYAPINQKYGEHIISVTPEKYLEKARIKKDNLYDDAQKYYDDFINKPTYNNLLNLKSQIGRDWAKISPSDQVRDIQLFNRYRNTLDNKVKNFLSRDQAALDQYEKANKYAENVFYPYVSTPTLKKIAKGRYETIYPKKMAESIDKATQRVVGQNYKWRIPEEHPLRNHLKNLKNRLTVGEISKVGLPPAIGALTGGLIHPMYGGLGGAGLGGALTSKLLSSTALRYPVVQSPVIQNIFKKLEPLYYGSGRGLLQQNE